MQPAATAVVRNLGLVPYQAALDQMREFSTARSAATPDEIWLLEHPPVYTLGVACTDTPLEPTQIPVVASDRGGQMTYHGPGQLIVYLLLDIRRRRQGIRNLITIIESVIIEVLDSYAICAARRRGAPGVYVQNHKIASLGIRIRQGCSYHGFSLNVDLDTAAFRQIVVCGMPGLQVTTLRELGVDADLDAIASRCVECLRVQLGYRKLIYD